MSNKLVYKKYLLIQNTDCLLQKVVVILALN